HPRADRPALPLLSPPAARSYIEEVRDETLRLLSGGARPVDERLLVDDFVYGMVIQHVHQHDETMLATIQLSGAVHPGGGPSPVLSAGMVLVAGGEHVVGTSSVPWAYDNERPAHVVDVAPFWIDDAPVTNAAYAEFIGAGGYD